jgi:hypothetical protein
VDPIIQNYPCIPFDEMNYCMDVGIMYQRDMSVSVSYDTHYFEHYIRLENTDIAKKLNSGRTNLTQKYCNSVLDIGIGSGEFIKESKIAVFGYDINPVAVRWLRQSGIYRDPYTEMPKVDGLTFWDVMEHIPNPTSLLSKIRSGMYVFVSIPIFTDLTRIKKSKHYKPNEHYYYYTSGGLIKYMTDSGFKIVEMSDQETRAGREDILTFVFCKN